MSFIWFLFIVYIIYIIYKNKCENEKRSKNMQEITRSSSNNTYNNSYYSNQKVDSYKKMNQDHLNHNDIKDITDSIGYKRCPICSSTVSKKSVTCFMCNYEFIKNEKKDN